MNASNAFLIFLQHSSNTARIKLKTLVEVGFRWIVFGVVVGG